MTNVELTSAFLIHRRTYQGSSLLLDFLTRDFGKIRLLARGVRKNKSSIQMFQHLKVSYKGRGDLKTLSGTEEADTPRRLLGNDLVMAIYANELLSRLLPEAEAQPEIFSAYQTLVEALSQPPEFDRQLALRLFENKFLDELGYGLDFQSDCLGELVSPELNYHFIEQQGFACHPDGKIPGAMLLKLADEDHLNLSPVELKITKGLNRQRLRVLLGEKPLKSRELFIVN